MKFYPEGSDSICEWCLNYKKCECFSDKYFLTFAIYGVMMKSLFRNVLKTASIRECPINGFNPNDYYIRKEKRNERWGEGIKI